VGGGAGGRGTCWRQLQSLVHPRIHASTHPLPAAGLAPRLLLRGPRRLQAIGAGGAALLRGYLEGCSGLVALNLGSNALGDEGGALPLPQLPQLLLSAQASTSCCSSACACSSTGLARFGVAACS
jgi:hypothetical protein